MNQKLKELIKEYGKINQFLGWYSAKDYPTELIIKDLENLENQIYSVLKQEE